MKLTFLKERMDVILSATVWKEANITLQGQWVVQQHLFCLNGVWMTAPEKHIQQLTDHFVHPVLGQATISKVHTSYWTKSLLKAITKLLENEWKDIVFDEFHAVLGGDHGCSVFSAPSKFIAFDSNGNVIKMLLRRLVI